MTKHYVGVADPKLVYVILEDRSEFDKIDLPSEDHAANERGGQCVSKTIKADGVMVVFQHWIRQSASPPVVEKLGTDASDTSVRTGAGGAQ